MKAIAEWMAEQNIILEGRYSEWEYYNSDHAFLAGKKGADRVRELQRQRSLAPPAPAVYTVGSTITSDVQ